jgi:hypothetical protein
MRQQENRGIKNPERFKLQQLKKEECERRQEEAEKTYTGERGMGLKVIIEKNDLRPAEMQLNYCSHGSLSLHCFTSFCCCLPT